MKANDVRKSGLVIVTPIYEDIEACGRLFKEIATSIGLNSYIVAVDDGSVMKPVGVSSIENAGLNGVVIRLTRNVGHQLAIAIGLKYVFDKLPEAQRIIVMDSDGEDKPSTIHDLIKQLESKEVDIVVAQRQRRSESLKFRFFYIIYKIIFLLFSGMNINFGNFMAMNSTALKRLVSMQELSIHLASCVLKSKLRITSYPIDRGTRYAGQSKMNYTGLVLHGLKALMVFAENVFVRIGITCAFLSVLTIIGFLTKFAFEIFGYTIPIWMTILLSICFIIFLQTCVFTFMLLILSGVIRSISSAPVNYNIIIDKVMHAK